MTWTALTILAIYMAAAAHAAPQSEAGLKTQHQLFDLPGESGSSSDLFDLMQPMVAGSLPNSRMLNGTVANPAEFPSSVLIINDEELFCSGALIGRKHVLSTFACLDILKGTRARVVAGEVNFANIPSSTTVQTLPAVRGHSLTDSLPIYPGNMALAIIELEGSFNITSHIQVATFATSKPDGNTEVVATSWVDRDALSMSMKKLEGMETIGGGISVGGYDFYDVVLAYIPVGSAICKNDGGAPLYTAAGKQLLGSASVLLSSTFCGRAAGFTSAVYYRGWIDCVLDPKHDPEGCDPHASTTTTTTRPTTTTRSSAASSSVAQTSLLMIVAVTAGSSFNLDRH